MASKTKRFEVRGSYSSSQRQNDRGLYAWKRQPPVRAGLGLGT